MWFRKLNFIPCRALETVQVLNAERSGRFDTRVMKESPQTFFGRPSFKSEAGSVHRFCGMCKELHGDHLGQHCTHTRICGLGGCREVHHRLLHKDQTYFPGGEAKSVVKAKLVVNPNKRSTVKLYKILWQQLIH